MAGVGSAASAAFAGQRQRRPGPSQRCRAGFERFLRRYEAANTAFVNGDASLWLSITAERNPASIFGGFGGLGETAWRRSPALPAAATAFRPSGATVRFDYLVKDVRDRLA